ncbi:unnamed protein product, partial [Mesorhabditis belari]|uniref:BHLH domain-containing protein n=1 Tax=Mesorhabditis belari TaxID=2138241 RepID=A0AAF3EP29_9BILA
MSLEVDESTPSTSSPSPTKAEEFPCFSFHSNETMGKLGNFEITESLLSQLFTADLLQKIYAEQVHTLATALINFTQGTQMVDSGKLKDLEATSNPIEIEEKQKPKNMEITSSSKYSTNQNRIMANERERLRVQSIGKMLTELRECLPCASPRLSKISVLRLAIHYIAYLAALVDESEEAEIHKERFLKTLDAQTRSDKRTAHRSLWLS